MLKPYQSLLKTLVCWPSVFWRPGVSRPKKSHMVQEKSGLVALITRASEKPLGQHKHFGIPLICYSVVFLGRTSGFQARFRPVSNPESFKICPLAGRSPAGGPTLRLFQEESDRNSARELDFRRGLAFGRYFILKISVLLWTP